MPHNRKEPNIRTGWMLRQDQPRRRKLVLHKFVETIRHAGAPTGFDGYYSKLRRSGLSGSPTRGEARRDYRGVTTGPNFVL